MNEVMYKIETECHCEPKDPLRCQIHDKDPQVRATAWEFRCWMAERKKPNWLSRMWFMFNFNVEFHEHTMERIASDTRACTFVDSRGRRCAYWDGQQAWI